jgi:hypothetical protein
MLCRSCQNRRDFSHISTIRELTMRQRRYRTMPGIPFGGLPSSHARSPLGTASAPNLWVRRRFSEASTGQSMIVSLLELNAVRSVGASSSADSMQ